MPLESAKMEYACLIMGIVGPVEGQPGHHSGGSQPQTYCVLSSLEILLSGSPVDQLHAFEL